jgi:hypothetical protein
LTPRLVVCPPTWCKVPLCATERQLVGCGRPERLCHCTDEVVARCHVISSAAGTPAGQH